MIEDSPSKEALRLQCKFVCDLMVLAQNTRGSGVNGQLSQLEKDVVYRSDFLILLYKYLEDR
jgi:hypothetical protein